MKKVDYWGLKDPLEVRVQHNTLVLFPGHLYQPPYCMYKKIILTNRSHVNDPPILAQKQPKMAIFEKADYWGLKDPLEVRVQHKTLVLYAGHLFQPFGTKKI